MKVTKPDRSAADIARSHRVACAILRHAGQPTPPEFKALLPLAEAFCDDPFFQHFLKAFNSAASNGTIPSVDQIAEHLDVDEAGGLELMSTAENVLSLETAASECNKLFKQAYPQRVENVLGDAYSAISSSPRRAKDIAARAAQDLAALTGEAQASEFPVIKNAGELLADINITLPPQIIEGVLHQGLKAVLGSNSKARKTWILLDAAISVATGTPFWKWATRKGRVLYINLEIPEPFIRSRIKCLCEKKGVTDLSNLDVWTLRGHGAALGRLLPVLLSQIQSGKYALLVLDPIYKTLGGRDENAAGDISELCNELERLTVETGSALLYAAHFSKGNQSSKEAIDRIGGSGVFTRDADSIITLTRHKTEGAYTVDMILRNLPEQSPFVVEWDFPVMKVSEHLDPDELRQPGGRKQEHESNELWQLLTDSPLTSTDWQKQADSELGMSRRTFYNLRKQLENSGRILKSKASDKWTPIIVK